MTTLYLCRHAIAADPKDGASDADRPLTPEGIKKFRKAAKGLVKLLGAKNLSHILSSPLLRARQTAEILSEALAEERHDIPQTISDALKPPGDLKRLLKEVRSLKGASGIVAVAHEPFLSQWIGELCFDRAGRVELKKGGVAAIELADVQAKGDLLWLMQPGMLRDI
jgi:phosphohistidine phosphatase